MNVYLARGVEARAGRLQERALDAQGRTARSTAWSYTLQVAPDDCTGCGICVDICPTRSKKVVKHKAINMEPKLDHLEAERRNYEFYLGLPETRPAWDTIDLLQGLAVARSPCSSTPAPAPAAARRPI